MPDVGYGVLGPAPQTFGLRRDLEILDFDFRHETETSLFMCIHTSITQQCRLAFIVEHRTPRLDTPPAAAAR
jgi:hypothetical protein